MDWALTYIWENVNCPCDVSYKMENEMKLEVGCYYRTRDGRRVGPMRNDAPYIEEVLTDGSKGWWNNGRYRDDGEDHELDLIAEWHDEPKQHGIGYTMTKAEIERDCGLTGTLAELNVQVGDVVEDMVTSDIYDILEVSDSGVRGRARRDGRELMLYMMAKARIVSRAKPQGPVITETVTRKRIVPGVYGKVEVTEVGNVWMHPTTSHTALTAAIETLTAVRDAMAS